MTKLITVFEPSKNTGLNCVQIVSCDVTVTVSRRFCGVSSTIVYYHFGRRATFDFRLEVYVQRVLYDVRRKTLKIK